MSMSRAYAVDTGQIAISATGDTPALYLSVPAAADANVFKLVPSIEAGAAVPTVPSNSDLNWAFTLSPAPLAAAPRSRLSSSTGTFSRLTSPSRAAARR